MQYAVARGEKGKIEVKVDVPQAAFNEAYDKVLLQLAAQSNISGFRPGKVPTEIVESHVGHTKVLNDVASFLISQHLSQILKKEVLVPLDSPKVAIHTLAKGSPFSFSVSFIQKPKVKVGDWKAIKVKKIAAKEVGEADINQSIKNIFEAWKKQKATEGQRDKAGEDIEGQGKFIFERSEKIKGSAVPRQRDEKAFIYDAHGNKIMLGDEKGAQNKKIEAFKIDDEFARTIGAKDLAHLRQLVKKDLETIVADQVEVKFEQDLYDQLLGIVQVEVPDILIDDELNRILVRLSTELEKEKKELDDYLKEQNTTIDALKAKWRPQAEKNVKITLVMDEIGRGEGVKVSKEEIEQALKGVNETNLSADQKQDLERYIALSIFQAKTLDLVKKAVST